MSAVLMSVVERLIPEFEKLKKRLPPSFDSTLVLPFLHRVQDERGYVAEEDIVALTDYLGVPRMQIEQVLSYYTMFRRKPIGRWHLQACRNVTCSMRGSERLVDALSRKLGIKPGQTTADGRVTLSEVECLGSCGTAPVVMVNEAYHENLSIEKLDELLGRLS
ncbi:MAG TPA: NADH-quinone oxidoreductase subunit NuoE [Burkholderiaceae bacterium]|nr:NADH-quinone oxidoreductase subunit NuoE [Burkholderiaceae bacterium]